MTTGLKRGLWQGLIIGVGLIAVLTAAAIWSEELGELSDWVRRVTGGE